MQTFVVHGEPESAQMLATRLRNDLGFNGVVVPSLHQIIEI
jgi:lactam utilization protein B